jgi:hypothetical protein
LFFVFLVVVDVIVCSIPPTLSFIIFYIIFAVCLRASLLLFICLFFKRKDYPTFYSRNVLHDKSICPPQISLPVSRWFRDKCQLAVFFGERWKQKKTKQNWEPRERWSWGVPTAHLNLYDFIKNFFFGSHLVIYQRGKGKQNWMANVLIWNKQKMCFFLPLYSPNDPPLIILKINSEYIIQRLLLCPQAPRTNVPTSKALLSKKKKRRRSKQKKNIQFNMKSGATPVFFFLLLSPYFFFLKLFVSVKSTFFRSKLSSFSSFSLSSCWSCRDAISLYTHEKKQKKN